MLDGPQALAAPGRSMRECDRLSGAAGKTPDRHELVIGKPFAGFVLSSVDLFGRLAAAGLAISPVGFAGGVGEVYPADLWKRLHRGLAKKGTLTGIAQRRAVLGVCGVTLPPSALTHDQLDAAVAALVAAAAA